MKFIASRLSDSNKLFPAEIHIEENGVLVKIPNLFKGKRESFPFDKISKLSVDTPLIGFSTITFPGSGTRVTAHGFKKSEVNEIKAAIERGRKSSKVIDRKSSYKQKPYMEPVPSISEQLIQPMLTELEQVELKKKELELLYLSKEKELAWQRELNIEEQQRRNDEIDYQKRLRSISDEDKQKILDQGRLIGPLIYFWTYILNKLWKKIVFVYLLLYVFVLIFR